MLSTSQILILLLILLAAALFTLYIFITQRKAKIGITPDFTLYLVLLLFITFLGLEIIYFRYYISFILDYSWSAIFLTFALTLLLGLPLLRFMPGKAVMAFLKLPVPPAGKVSQVLKPPAAETIKPEEPVIISEVVSQENVKTADVITGLPVETELKSAEESTAIEEPIPIEAEPKQAEVSIIPTEKKTEEVKPKQTRAHVKKTAKPKAPPKAHTKKPVVHKTKKKLP